MTNSLDNAETADFSPDANRPLTYFRARSDYAPLRMTSGAGHDAQMMSRICPTAMIFVPSRDGISHNPLEHTDAVALIAGARVMLDAVSKITHAV